MGQRLLLNNFRSLLQVSRKQFLSSTERCENEVRLLGRAGNNATSRGSLEHPVVQFTLATHSSYRLSDGETKQKTQWHKVAVFKPGLRQLAEEYVKKGIRMSVKGKIEYGELVDHQGYSKPTTTIIADDIIFLTKTMASNSEPEDSLDG